MLELNKKTNIEYFSRPRINALLEQATEKPLVLVCAGAGYGKTRAIADFVQKNNYTTIWIQCSDFDNVSTRFWENFVHTIMLIDQLLAKELKELGFPDTDDKMNRFYDAARRYMQENPALHWLYVMDDFHLVTNTDIISFVEHTINAWLKARTVILICRSLPIINILTLQAEGLVQYIVEKDLAFTETELAEYLRRQGLSIEPQILNKIFQDTNGWAFSINLIARSLKKSAGYMGYVNNAIKHNIFSLMESEIWNAISNRLKRFLLRLSLIEHLSAELITTLADKDDSLIAELQQQSAYIRYDSDIDAYLIHHLFKGFLRAKQELLTDEEKRKTYRAAAHWCIQNHYIVDALGYCEKVGDYESIVSISFELTFILPYDLALYMVEIFERVPAELFTEVDFLAAMHLRALISLGRWQESVILAENYEQTLQKLTEDSILRKHTLCLMYYFWGYLRLLRCTADHRYDFDIYFTKMNDFRTDPPIELGQMYVAQTGPWSSLVGSARAGAPQEFLNAALALSHYMNDFVGQPPSGSDNLIQGELLFYQGDVGTAETLFNSAFVRTQDCRQFEFAHRALFYTMRIAFVLGKYQTVEQVIKRLTALLDEKDYSLRFVTYDIALGWYYYLLRQPESVPNWLKEKFAPYSRLHLAENFGNQMKARYHYLIKDYQSLLTYLKR